MKEQLLNELTLTYLKKNKDYGNSADRTYHKFGDISYLIRIHDKIARVETLLSSDKPEVAESIHDTILDLIVYTAMYNSIDCEPRIVGLANSIHAFLNNPEWELVNIIEQMPEGITFKEETTTFICDYINKLAK